MHIPWIEDQSPLPPPESAQTRDSELAGLVAAGGGLSVNRLKEAYRQGMFPWFSEGQPILWWSPDPRMVLETKNFKLHRSLRKTLQHFIAAPNCEVRIDSNFNAVIHQCAETSRKGQAGTWIVKEMIDAYKALHQAGYAHSIETWVNQELVGGLYCVSIGDAVFGESMFSHQTDASKIALAALVAFARAQGLTWIDCQQNTKHLASLGAREMTRAEFLDRVRIASAKPNRVWTFEHSVWEELLLQRIVL